MFKVREFAVGDEVVLYKLFHDAVHTINAKDYNEEQLNVWAPEEGDLAKWRDSLGKNHTFIVYDDMTNQIVGFADLENSGYIDRGYVHKDFQARGIGLIMLKAIEAKARALGMKELYAEVSITTKQFLEFFGYIVESEQTVVRGKIKLINYKMRKQLL